MKTEKNFLIVFILNLLFSLFEFAGGIFTGSIAIISDSLHDLGDASSILVSYFFEKKSHKEPDNKYTFGYGRFSILGGMITSSVLIISSAVLFFHSTKKFTDVSEINYNGMIVFSFAGMIINSVSAFITHKDKSVNGKAVNLHLLEDVLGWIAVFAGAIIMKLTDFVLIDPIISIAVSIFIFINAAKNLKEATEIFLDKIPDDISIDEIKEKLCIIDGITDVHSIRIRKIDNTNNCATMHIITNNDFVETKKAVRSVLKEYSINIVTLELETKDEMCKQ